MKTPVIKVGNLTEEEFNILYDICKKRKVDKNSLIQFYVTSFESKLNLASCASNGVLDTEIECFTYSEFMKLYKECSLEHIL